MWFLSASEILDFGAPRLFTPKYFPYKLQIKRIHVNFHDFFFSVLLFRSLSWFLKLFNNIFLSLDFCIVFVLLNFQTFVKILIEFFFVYEWFVVLFILFHWNDTVYVTAMFVCEWVRVSVCVFIEWICVKICMQFRTLIYAISINFPLTL